MDDFTETTKSTGINIRLGLDFRLCVEQETCWFLDYVIMINLAIAYNYNYYLLVLLFVCTSE